MGEATPTLHWRGAAVATLVPGRDLASPRVKLDRALDVLTPPVRIAVLARLEAWVAAQVARHAPGLSALSALTQDATAGAPLRAAAAALLGAGGIAPRRLLAREIAALDGDARRQLRAAGTVIGTIDLYDLRLLKPAAAGWRRTLLGVRGQVLADGAPTGATVVPRGSAGAELVHGFRPLGAQAVRVDLVERIARAAHDARQGRKPFAPDPALATSIGLTAETLARLLAQLGFKGFRGKWVWQGLPPPPPVTRAAPGNAFAALSEWAGG